MYRPLYTLIACMLLTGTCIYGSWFGESEETRKANLLLAQAIEAQDPEEASAALEAGANPNARFAPGADSLFIQAFEEALRRDHADKENPIISIDPEGARVAMTLASYGGNTADLSNHIRNTYFAGGYFLTYLFKTPWSAIAFIGFTRRLGLFLRQYMTKGIIKAKN